MIRRHEKAPAKFLGGGFLIQCLFYFFASFGVNSFLSIVPASASMAVPDPLPEIMTCGVIWILPSLTILSVSSWTTPAWPTADAIAS